MFPWILGGFALYMLTRPRNGAEAAAESGATRDAASELAPGAEGGELDGDRTTRAPSEEV